MRPILRISICTLLAILTAVACSSPPSDEAGISGDKPRFVLFFAEN